MVRARQVIIVGGTPPGSGLFVYSPAIAAGDLIASITATPGHDSPGNAIPASGVFSYRLVSGTWMATGISQGAVAFYTAASEAGPWTQQAIIQEQIGGAALVIQTSNGDIQLVPAGNIVANLASGVFAVNGASGHAIAASNTGATSTIDIQQSAAGNPAVTIELSTDADPRLEIDSNGTLSWGTGAAAAQTTLGLAGLLAGLTLTVTRSNFTALSVTNTLNNAGQSLVQLTGQAATDRAIGIQIASDTNERIRVDQTPAVHLGSGTAGPDCTILRAGPDQLAMDYIAYSLNGGTVETWQVPTFSNGWANAPTGPNLQYRRVAAPYNSVQWEGRIVAPAGVVVGQLITTSPTIPYHPANLGDMMAWDVTQGAVVMLRVGTGGALSYQGGAVPANGDIITLPAGNGLVSLDA